MKDICINDDDVSFAKFGVELTDLNSFDNNSTSYKTDNKVGPNEEEWIKEEPLISID
jgi:hypothetical protein